MLCDELLYNSSSAVERSPHESCRLVVRHSIQFDVLLFDEEAHHVGAATLCCEREDRQSLPGDPIDIDFAIEEKRS
jgi:hypothetical protein